jgi:hypothetical protein
MAENASSSASSTETTDKKEEVSSSLPVSTANLEAHDQLDFCWDGNREMNFGMYYASLAEGLMLDPPAELFADSNDDQWGMTVSLWN